jgi:hypothetical protein
MSWDTATISDAAHLCRQTLAGVVVEHGRLLAEVAAFVIVGYFARRRGSAKAPVCQRDRDRLGSSQTGDSSAGYCFSMLPAGRPVPALHVGADQADWFESVASTIYEGKHGALSNDTQSSQRLCWTPGAFFAAVVQLRAQVRDLSWPHDVRAFR